MHKRVVVEGLFPTPEQMADELGVSRAHLAELRTMLEENGFFSRRAIKPETAKKAAAKKRATRGAKRG